MPPGPHSRPCHAGLQSTFQEDATTGRVNGSHGGAQGHHCCDQLQMTQERAGQMEGIRDSNRNPQGCTLCSHMRVGWGTWMRKRQARSHVGTLTKGTQFGSVTIISTAM